MWAKIPVELAADSHNMVLVFLAFRMQELWGCGGFYFFISVTMYLKHNNKK
jgi:hypothetical protein